MPTEVATFIEELDPNRPADTETAGEADDHLRLLKATINATFVGQIGVDVFDIAQLTGPRKIDGFDARIIDIENDYMSLTSAQLVLVEHEFQVGLKLSNNATIDGEDIAGTTDFTLLGVNVSDEIDAGDATVTYRIRAPDNKVLIETTGSVDNIALHEGNALALLGQAITDAQFPVGAVYLTFTNTNPSTFLLGTSTWVNEAAGRFIVGVGEGTDANAFARTYAAGNDAIGEYTHAQTIAEMALHGHPWRRDPTNQGTAQANTTGGYMTSTAGARVNRPAFTGTPSDVDGEQIGGEGGGAVAENSPTAYGAYLWRRTA